MSILSRCVTAGSVGAFLALQTLEPAYAEVSSSSQRARSHLEEMERNMIARAVAAAFVADRLVVTARIRPLLTTLWMESCRTVRQMRLSSKAREQLSETEIQAATTALQNGQWLGVAGIACDRAIFYDGSVRSYVDGVWNLE